LQCLTIQHSQQEMVETPMVETVTVETPMVEMHTATMAMHIPAALVLQLVVAAVAFSFSVSLTEIQLTAELAATAELAELADSAAAAATHHRINT
jgi:hypothetical protein